MSDLPGSQADKDETSPNGSGGTQSDLLQLLVEKRLISAAQAQLALADQEVSGMTLSEVLLARSWVDESTLYSLAPWLKKSGKTDVTRLVKKPGKNFEENLKQYRQIMEQILGTPWD